MLKQQKAKQKYTNDDLKTMQGWDLDRKIAVSLTKIAEFHAQYPHEIYVLSHQRFIVIIVIEGIHEGFLHLSNIAHHLVN